MTLEEKLNKVEKQNSQILFLLNLLVSSSEFSVCEYSDDGRKQYGFITPGRRNCEEGTMDKKTFVRVLKSYVDDGGVPQEILDEVVKTK